MKNQNVSILVLMDVALKLNAYNSNFQIAIYVSILVLMDVALKQNRKIVTTDYFRMFQSLF